MKIKYIDKLNWLLLKSIVFFIPVSFLLFTNESQSNYNFSFRVSLADIFVLISITLLVLKVILYRGKIEIKWPEKPWVYFMIAMLISIINVESIFGFAKEFVQLSLSFFAWYIVLINSKLSDSMVRKLIVILIFSSCCLIPIAIYQYYVDKQHPYFVRSLFVNRNIYGAYIAVIIPLLLALFYNSKSVLKKSGWILIIGLALFSMLAYGHVFAAIIGILVMGMFKGRKFLLTSIIGMGLYIMALAFIVPKQSYNELFRSLEIHESYNIKNSIRQVWHFNSASRNGSFASMDVKDNKIFIASDVFMPYNVIHHNLLINKELKSSGDVLKQYYAEWIAVQNLLNDVPFTGCGLGNYQDMIGGYYGYLPKNNTSEPDYLNGYMVLVASAGLLGLLTFLFLLYQSVMKLVRTIIFHPVDKNRNFQIGLLGSLITVVVVNFFTPIFNAQIVTVCVFILFLCKHFSKIQLDQR